MGARCFSCEPEFMSTMFEPMVNITGLTEMILVAFLAVEEKGEEQYLWIVT